VVGGVFGAAAWRRLLWNLESPRARVRHGWPTLAILLAVLALGAGPYARRAWAAQIEVCFSPPLPGGCDPARVIEAAIGAAHISILVMAYEITPGPLVTALIEAHRRGVKVRAIVDYRQFTDRHNRDDAFGVERLGAAGIPVLVDRPPGLMHDKVMVIDGGVVITGSFNYTYSAEHRNVENLLVIHDPALAAQYTRHWHSRASRSRPLRISAGSASGESSIAREGSIAMDSASPPAVPQGPIVGNRRSHIYEWPGCPFYGKVSAANRVEFSSAQAAEQAGYRAAHNCR
jgi:phosphatidylserine/phosphatidylglycerophosphate/cardiolipin synthase-like enzyme